jgi:hypothetical protein
MPRLIVVISIDQFRYEYLERFSPWFSERGFKRFLNSGANFTNCNYLHATTFTGPGHASIGTGRTPSESGIVGNTWFERDAPYDAKMWEWFFDDSLGYTPPRSGAAPPPMPTSEGGAAPQKVPWWQAGGGSPRYCAFDERVKVTAGNSAGMSPLLLDSDSLGDRVKERYPNAHVIGVALKDRAAILMAGRKADAAYWFDAKLPGFVSSTAYHFDPSLFAFNARTMSYVPSSKQWTLSSTIPEGDLKRITFDPPEALKFKTARYETHFPHPINDARALTYTPFANDMLLDFAATIVEREKLGADEDPDVFYVGVSSPDYIGHYYGPDSMEVADDAVRLDRSIEHFIDGLEKKVGASRLVVAITADHGVQSTPEIAQLRDPRLDAGRTDLRNARRDAVSVSELPPLRIELQRREAQYPIQSRRASHRRAGLFLRRAGDLPQLAAHHRTETRPRSRDAHDSRHDRLDARCRLRSRVHEQRADHAEPERRRSRARRPSVVPRRSQRRRVHHAQAELDLEVLGHEHDTRPAAARRSPRAAAALGCIHQARTIHVECRADRSRAHDWLHCGRRSRWLVLTRTAVRDRRSESNPRHRPS